MSALFGLVIIHYPFHRSIFCQDENDISNFEDSHRSSKVRESYGLPLTSLILREGDVFPSVLGTLKIKYRMIPLPETVNREALWGIPRSAFQG